MENLIENGEEWMEPMLIFRDYLAEVRNNEDKRMNRSRDLKERLGPFKFEVRAELLEQLLDVQEQTDLELISKQELAAIQGQWNYDGCFKYNVSNIFEKVTGKKLLMNPEAQTQKAEEQKLLEEVAAEYNVNANHIKNLIIAEESVALYTRRKNIIVNIENKIKQFVLENEDVQLV